MIQILVGALLFYCPNSDIAVTDGMGLPKLFQGNILVYMVVFGKPGSIVPREWSVLCIN